MGETTPALRVGFLADAVCDGGGMGRYVREVLGQLGRRDDVELVVVVPPGGESRLDRLELSNLVTRITIRGSGQITRGLWERHRLGRVLERHGVGVVHGAKHIVPRTTIPTVLTVHDVMAITWRSQFSIVKRLLLPRQFRKSLHDATALVAVSQATARRLEGMDPDLASKIRVVPNAVSPALLDVAAEPVAELAGRRFALVVSDLSPRKNLSLLCDIWDDVERSTGLLLVSVGAEAFRSSRTRRAVDRLVAAGKARRYEGLPDPQLRWCYEQARVVLVPSKEEGFGLPLAEAVELGADVIASTDDALLEVGQGLVLHLDPDDETAWREAIVAGRYTLDRTPSSTPDYLSWSEHVDGLVDVYRLVVPDRRTISS